jgi:hypothetical protein
MTFFSSLSKPQARENLNHALTGRSSPPPPDPLACDLKLASAAVPAARRDSAPPHPGRGRFSFLTSKIPCQLPQLTPDSAKQCVRLPSACPALSCSSITRIGLVCACRCGEHVGLPRSRTCVCARHTAAPQRLTPRVGSPSRRCHRVATPAPGRCRQLEL